MCQSGAVLLKAGELADATITVDATLHGVEGPIETFILQAESYINTLCRYNFSGNMGSLTVNTTKLLEEACSNLAAIYVIQYNMSGYNRIVAEDMINILWKRFEDCIKLLEDQKSVTYMGGT